MLDESARGDATEAKAAGTAGGSTATTASGGASANEADPALQPVLRQVQGKLASLAKDPEAFHAALTKSFGDRYDKASAETIRQQTLAGDFSWMPKIEVVDGATLADTSGTQGDGQGLGAYSAADDTIFISRELLAGDPGKAASILTEEIGHGLDARLNTSDAAGDEGAIFSALVDGKELSASDLAALRTENDTGTIIVDGKEVEVEYGWFSKAKKKLKKAVNKVKNKVKDTVKKIGDKIVDQAKKLADEVKKGFKKIMQSELLGTIMSVLQYVPIPIVAAVATVYNTVRAGYMVYRGIKDKSFATALGGVAGLAGGAAKLGTAFGASEKFIKGAATISQRAGQASKLYAARGDLNFRNAVSIGASVFGDTKAGGYLRAADRGLAAKEAADNGDALGALALGADAFRELPGGRYDAALGSVSEHAGTVRTIVAAARDKDYASVISLVNEKYGTQLGLDDAGKAKVDDLLDVLATADTAVSLARGENKDYFGAAEMLFGKAAEKSSSPVVRERFQRGAETFGQIGSVRTAIDEGRLGKAADGTLALLGQPLDANTRTDLLDALESVDVLRGTSTDTGGEGASELRRAAVFGRGAYEAAKGGDELGALALGAEAFRELPGTRFDDTLGDVSRVAIEGRPIVEAARNEDYASAITLANENFGTRLGLDAEGKARVDELVDVLSTVDEAVSLARGEDKNYVGAAALLFDKGSELGSSPVVSSRFETGAGIFERIGTIRSDFDAGRLESATTGTLALLGEPLDEKTRDGLIDLLGVLDGLRGTSVEAGAPAAASPVAEAA